MNWGPFPRGVFQMIQVMKHEVTVLTMLRLGNPWLKKKFSVLEKLWLWLYPHESQVSCLYHAYTMVTPQFLHGAVPPVRRPATAGPTNCSTVRRRRYILDVFNQRRRGKSWRWEFPKWTSSYELSLLRCGSPRSIDEISGKPAEGMVEESSCIS